MSSNKFEGKACRVCTGTWRYKSNGSCVACMAAHGRSEKAKRRNKKYQEDNPLWLKEIRLRHVYGLSLTAYANLYEAQGGVCAICSEPPRGRDLSVDHDHSSGAVRGLLCQNCNASLGMMKEDPKRLSAAITYLTYHRTLDAYRSDRPAGH